MLASQLVAEEAAHGDIGAAAARLAVLADLPLLETNERALALARTVVRCGAVPARAPEDALHIAVAAAHGVEYLVTWNCRHMANVTMRGRIGAACRAAGCDPPAICTPEELMEVDNDGG